MTRMVDTAGLDEIIRLLRAEGRTVIAPTVRDGTIVPDEIESGAELPVGWTEDQNGGYYRLMATDTPERFAFSSPSDSWKRYLHPPRTLLVRTRRTDTGIDVESPDPSLPSVAFFGVRSCDLAAMHVLDQVFLDDAATDPGYAARRADAFIVAAGCAHPGNTCFCASMQTGPTPTRGYDLSVTELYNDGHHRFLIDSGSDRGADLLAQIDSRPATGADTAAAIAAHDNAVQHMGRTLSPSDPPSAAAHTDHPRWDDVAERCLACGNCTMVCPTCFCSSTQDSTGLTPGEAERWRVWDSCFTADFSSVHGGPVRSSTRSRYRQWLLHKLVTWHDQFDMSGCVGCGRCITACPVGIDLTAEIAALARPAAETGAGTSPTNATVT